MTDFERIRDSALGYLKPSERADWVRDISQEGSDYDAAYQKLMDVRERRPYVPYSTISKVPAVINTAPAMDFHVNFSWRNRNASTSVITTLSLSTGTTLDACPICRAR